MGGEQDVLTKKTGCYIIYLTTADAVGGKRRTVIMQKFMGEFKKFINRGNVVDMAVGVIVGSSFTAIVNSLSNNILKPLINYVLSVMFGADSLSEIYTFLKRVEVSEDIVDEAGEVIGSRMVPDMTQSIYIDWGTFINAVINFFLVATVLFIIMKTVNKIREEHREFTENLAKKTLSRDQRRELKARGVKIKDKAAVKAYFENKKKEEEEKARILAEQQAEAERKMREQNPTAEELLRQILAEMRKK